MIIAENLETLHWRLAIEIVAQSSPESLPPGDAERIRADFLDEQWAAGVERWLRGNEEILDVYDSWELYTDDDLELAPVELQLQPLFQDPPPR
ncbi:MAG: hypothetical protein M3527_03105 [Actinomycetota bacterium]|nr:hypothetical protein [Acidimicrobiia bacterium]MDQ3293427.1 hypothetical protein [Actinomycetota bacterium]